MKIFLDTSVLLSALISDGICQDLLHALHASPANPFDRFICMSSARVLQELKDLEGLEQAAPSKFAWSSFHTDAAEALFVEDYKLTPAATTPVPCKDEEDGWILADAKLANCDYFISGDEDVLAMYCVGTMRICTPREMLLWLRTGIPIPKFEAHQERADYLHLPVSDATN
jgi:putative PIN family toxin of toxin-antitoxin system